VIESSDVGEVLRLRIRGSAWSSEDPSVDDDDDDDDEEEDDEVGRPGSLL